MRYFPLFLGLILAMLCTGIASAVEYEPFLRISLSQQFTAPNGQTQNKTEICHTIAELPWIPLDGEDWAMPPQGFTASTKPAVVQWHNKKLKGEKIVWRRQEEFANHKFKEVHIVRSDMVPTPAFMIPLSQQPDLPVPAGCVRLEVVPLQAGFGDANDFDILNTISLSGASGEPMKFHLGERELQAHSFHYTLKGKHQVSNTTIVISREMPGTVCRIEFDIKGGRRAGRGSISVADVSAAPLPAGMVDFPEKGFALAPPAGYTRVAGIKGKEIVRFKSSRGGYISVSSLDLGREGLSGYRRFLSDTVATDGNMSISVDRSHRVAGHESFTVCDTERKDGYIVTERKGKGYKIFISKLYVMRPADVETILYGWRWIK